MKDLQKKYNTKETEEKWQKYWKDNKIFKFDWNDIERKNIFSIDTPPPHVSGSLHMGHIFGYSQMDTIARFWRMFGKNVFYPVGFDDNGLPSERYVEKKIGKKSKSMNRQEFVKICDKEIQDAEEFMKDQFIRMNYSYDFDLAYRTISPTARKVSQMSFIDLYNKGALYRKEEPIIWDVVDQTALAQTEAEDKEIESQMNFINFDLIEENTNTSNFQADKITIMTTRPELLPACVAIFAHPDDKEKYKNKYVITPLGVKVPILFDESVEKDKGTGVMMCCTFGDNADVEKYKKYNLPLKIIINEKGCLYFDNVPEIDNKYKLRLDGLFTEKARVEILNILKEEGKIAKDPEKILHNVKIGERSKSPLEILVKSQWNIKTLDIKEELHKKASEVNWYPKWMETRIHNWIDGLNWNWTISRQRFFGVPVPCWYSKKTGEEGKVILPEIEDLPVDPTIDLPKGYSTDEIVPENDVFDTWMTSSISPQLSMWGISENMNCDKERFEILDIPFDLRTQGHDIIRTWAFCTLVKSYYHENKIPWKDIFVNGFCLAADGTKMSKSKGNGVDPLKVIDEFGADAVRYWALNSQLGTDTNYSVDMIKIGQKLITKLYNSAKFVEMNFKNLTGKIFTARDDIENNLIFESMDKWLISKMKSTIEKTTQSFKKYDYSKALETAEKFFWDDFCDNYLEIVKVRCYGASGFKYENLELTEEEIEKINKSQQSAIRTIYYVFNAMLKLFSPFMPSITEEIYSIIYENEFNDKKSISTRGNWPNIKDFTENSELEIQGNIALDIIAEVRKYKSEKQISIKEKLECIYVNGNYGFDKGIIEDLKNVCNVKYILFNKDEINNNNYKSVKILVIDTEEKLQKLLNYAED